MRTRTVAPMSARVLSIVSLVLSLLWVVAYILCIVFQRDIRTLFTNYPEANAVFVMPIAPLASNVLPLLVQAAIAVLLCVFWKKAVWSRGVAITLVAVEAVLALMRSVLGSVVSSFENIYMGSYGTAMLVAYSATNNSLAYVGFLFSAAVICMILALVILCYRCGIDAKAQKIGGYQA